MKTLREKVSSSSLSGSEETGGGGSEEQREHDSGGSGKRRVLSRSLTLLFRAAKSRGRRYSGTKTRERPVRGTCPSCEVVTDDYSTPALNAAIARIPAGKVALLLTSCRSSPLPVKHSQSFQYSAQCVVIFASPTLSWIFMMSQRGATSPTHLQ